ncbi:alpha/beta hydrolase [Allostreptomyces psammosilenae]|uniref:Serine aminopeptidase S33 domain-containing protein n=1 Tax=Allostreptomyces psammosilenae TaxID=1892865 RepID=A0A852ZR22_9ACTN|nr:alpha/beta hydrolase [Allostreptomyces psammosilenae]NYI03304.1 hypothetical protein [Allostreptomyces psammosilenae]
MRRATLTATATLAGGTAAAAAAIAAAGRSLSNLVLDPRRTTPAPVRVLSGGSDHVVLERNPWSALPGTFGLTWSERHTVLGEVVEATDVSVSRTVVAGPTPPAGTPARLTPALHRGDPGSALGLEHERLAIKGELGDLPAWYVPAERRTCVVVVHGIVAGPEHALNVLPLLHDLKLPTVSVTYRGDPGAPPSPDGIRHLGDTEWRDVDAVLRHAVSHGAHRIVLLGLSTGAAIALQAADRSPVRDRVVGLVLDSPVLDWRAVLRRQASLRGVPERLLPLGVRSVVRRTGIDLDRFDWVARAGDLAVPTLLVHGPDDPAVPWEPTRRLAELRPDVVMLHRVVHAGHGGMWNADPTGYAERLRRFLTALV